MRPFVLCLLVFSVACQSPSTEQTLADAAEPTSEDGCTFPTFVSSGASPSDPSRTVYHCYLSQQYGTGIMLALYDDQNAWVRDAYPTYTPGMHPIVAAAWVKNADTCEIDVLISGEKAYSFKVLTLDANGRLNTVEMRRYQDGAFDDLGPCYYDLSPAI